MTLMNDKAKMPKCPFCDFKSADFEVKKERKKHLTDKHHTEMVGFANKRNLTFNQAVGYQAAFFISFENENL